MIPSSENPDLDALLRELAGTQAGESCPFSFELLKAKADLRRADERALRIQTAAAWVFGGATTALLVALACLNGGNALSQSALGILISAGAVMAMAECLRAAQGRGGARAQMTRSIKPFR